MQHIRVTNFLHWLLSFTPSAVRSGICASVIKLIEAFFLYNIARYTTIAVLMYLFIKGI